MDKVDNITAIEVAETVKLLDRIEADTSTIEQIGLTKEQTDKLAQLWTKREETYRRLMDCTNARYITQLKIEYLKAIRDYKTLHKEYGE